MLSSNDYAAGATLGFLKTVIVNYILNEQRHIFQSNNNMQNIYLFMLE